MFYRPRYSFIRAYILWIILIFLIGGCNPDNISSPSPLPTTISEPTSEATPSRIPTQTTTPIPRTPTPTSSQVEKGSTIEVWKGLEIGPPGVTLAHEAESFLTLESPDSLLEIGAFYQSRLIYDGWILIESLFSPETRFEGEIIFTHFWKPNEQSLCIFASSNPNPPSPQAAATIVVSFDCGSARMTAEKLQTLPWTKPGQIEWTIEELAGFVLSLPSEWDRDPAMDQELLCSLEQINCIIAFTFQEGEAEGIFIVFSWPIQDPDLNLYEQSVNAWEDGADAVPGIFLISIEPILLNDGNEAVQIISGFPTPSGSGLLSSITTIKGDGFYSLNATIFGDFPELAELNEIAIAAARSFTQISAP